MVSETLLGLIPLQVRPLGTTSVRVIVPENPLTALIVMVELEYIPAITADGDVAAIL